MRLIEGSFLARLNRFVAEVEIGGVTVLAHVPSSGRMQELLTPGRRVLLAKSMRPGRKTDFGLRLVDMGGFYVSIDSILPNKLVHKSLKAGKLYGLEGYGKIIPEYPYLDSRFDFYLADPGECFLEVKSVTLVEDGVARFPDAPTLRGTKHLEHLAGLRRLGVRAGVIFIIQRQDAEIFEPNGKTDPDFALALRNAKASGVEIWAYTCKVTGQSVEIDREVPVKL
ncbi:MAG TPA: DNA/RNA nuclease SfsA [Verrucomicrobiae bacterium]|nr:DNA/RNA nuclease SfsA [Verrucomicrobiae bacterium]